MMSPLLPLALLGSSVLLPTHVAVYFLEETVLILEETEFIRSLLPCWGGAGEPHVNVGVTEKVEASIGLCLPSIA